MNYHKPLQDKSKLETTRKKSLNHPTPKLPPPPDRFLPRTYLNRERFNGVILCLSWIWSRYRMPHLMKVSWYLETPRDPSGKISRGRLKLREGGGWKFHFPY